MNLKSLPLLLALTAVMATSTVNAATTGTLHFKGQVNGGTCNLAAGDVSRTITLPEIKISDFGGNTHAGIFNFEISADCEADISNVSFVFNGTADTSNGMLFRNTGTSGGTALWLLSQVPNQPIPANGTPAQRTRTIATSGNKAVLPLRVAYHKNGEPVTKGTLESTVQVSITYD